MIRKYISDIVTSEIISTWKLGQKYLIKSGTGSGKSYWVKNVLYEYCKNKGFKILLLSNRNILKNQNKADLGVEKQEIITAVNYQYIESQVLSNEKTLEEFYERFKVIVFDEAHFFNTDSQFNRQTDLLMDTILNPPKNKILVLITATPQVILKYNNIPKENIYDMKTNYNYITQLAFYSKEQTPEGIVQSLPEGEKCLYFGDAMQAWELKNKFDDSSFVCSKGNRLYKEKVIMPTVKEIVETSTFSSTLLCTTKVLDNGVNILDKDLKTIIIDTLDPITLIQELGRKRVIDENDNVRVFIHNQHRGIINFNLLKIREQLKSLSDFETMDEETFIKKYRKKNYSDVIDNDRKVNIAKKQNLLFLQDIYSNMMKDANGYKILICKILGKQIEEISNGDIEVEKIGVREILEKYVGIKLFKEEQDKFKQAFFNSIFSPKNTNYRHRAIRSITAVILEDNLPYEINSRKEYKGTGLKNGKTYWLITKI